MDLRLTGDISLNVNRATYSSTNCSHPQCSERNKLRRIPIETRYILIKKLRFYIPPKGLGCELHRYSIAWSANDVDESSYPFTRNQIEDMIDLLRFEPKRLNFVAPGL